MTSTPMRKRHSFTIKGFIERGNPRISWSVSFVDADSIEEAISQIHGMFKEPVVVSDVIRIMSQAREIDS